MAFKIGYRTLKTAVGAGVAIAIAQALQLEFYSAGAIIAILCTSITRRSSLKASGSRIAACLIGMTVSVIFFQLLGYYPWTLTAILLVFIPLSVMARVKEGIVTSSVIILHLYTIQALSVEIIVNELLLIVIGVGVALLMNVYMPNIDRELHHYHQEIEDHFKTILRELATYLRHGESDWDGKEIPETVQLLQEGQNVAFRNIQNHILRYEDQYYYYFKMREKQFEILERVMPFVSKITHSVPQGETLADFLSELSGAVSPANRVPYFREKLRAIKQSFQETDLPATREEFEVRSALLYIMYEMEQYLYIKDRLWNKADKKKL